MNLTPKYQITFNESPENGSVVATVLGSEISSGDNAILGLTVLFTATPSSGYHIESWSVNGETVTIDKANYTGETLLIEELMDDLIVEVYFSLISAINPESISDFVVYPNPFSNSLTIDNDNGIRKVSIVNILGQRMMEKTFDGTQNQTLSTSHLANGIYLLVIETQTGERITKRIVKE